MSEQCQPRSKPRPPVNILAELAPRTGLVSGPCRWEAHDVDDVDYRTERSETEGFMAQTTAPKLSA